MKEFIKVMKAVSDPIRVKILKMLQRRRLCVFEVQAALGSAQSTARKHLKIVKAKNFFKKNIVFLRYVTI